MKIETVKVTALSFPLKKPIKTNIHLLETITGIELNIYDASGNEGKSFARGFGQISYQAIICAIKILEKILLSEKVWITQEFWLQFWRTYKQKKSIVEIYALAAWDIAVWDLLAKQANKPLYQLLSHEPIKKIPVYGTTGWHSLTENELIGECQYYEGLGINEFKIRLGHEHDYHRVKAVREAMPPDYILMLDANERYSVSEAIHVAKKMADLNITWFEEPCETSRNNLLKVIQESPIAIATGENIVNVDDFVELSQHNPTNILQPDILRCGGITGFINVANAISQYSVKLCNHLLPELSISLMSSYENAYFLEYDNLLPLGIFTQAFTINDGCIDIPQVAGSGVELTQEAVKSFKIEKM